MKKIIASAAALTAALAFSLPAFAQEVMGVIKTYRSGDRVVILEDGTQYRLSEGVTVQEFKPGTKVKYIVEDRGGVRTITKIVTTTE